MSAHRQREQWSQHSSVSFSHQAGRPSACWICPFTGTRHWRSVRSYLKPPHLISSAPATNSHITMAQYRSSLQGSPTKSAEKIALLIHYPAMRHRGKIWPPSRQVYSFAVQTIKKMYLVTCGGVQTVDFYWIHFFSIQKLFFLPLSTLWSMMVVSVEDKSSW